jgi:hypothetical protein
MTQEKVVSFDLRDLRFFLVLVARVAANARADVR